MMAAEPSPSAAAAAASDDLETLVLDSSSSSAAVASTSTDPLLRPPRSPTAAAARDPFDFLDDDDDDDDFSPAPPPSVPRPTAERADASREFTKIIVSDPKKHAEPAAGAAGVIPGSGGYFSYLITTTLVGTGEVVRVRRRFRDVVALADRLAATHRGMFIPVRPDKSVLEGQVIQRHEFVSQRCAALQLYLCRLAAHPVVGHSADLRAFLTQPGAIPTFEGEPPRYWTTTANAVAAAAAQAPAPAKSGRALFGMFKDLKQTVVNGLAATKPPPVEQETDTEFLAHKARLEDLKQQLTTTFQQAEALVKAQDRLGETAAHLGMTLVKLSKFEKEQATSSPQRSRAGDIHDFAFSVLKFSRLHTKLNPKIGKDFAIIHDYMKKMPSVDHAFTDRANALHHIQSLSADLYSLHNRAGRLDAPPKDTKHEWSNMQKADGLRVIIESTEAAKIDAIKDYEKIKENNMIEIKRFDKERHHDFVEMLKGFATKQVSYADHFAETWAKVAEDTKIYANRGN